MAALCTPARRGLRGLITLAVVGEHGGVDGEPGRSRGELGHVEDLWLVKGSPFNTWWKQEGVIWGKTLNSLMKDMIGFSLYLYSCRPQINQFEDLVPIRIKE